MAETSITFPSKVRVLVLVNAKLRPDFEPIEIEMKRTVVNPDGSEKVVVQRAASGPKTVKLSTEADGQQTEGEAPRPERPFIYAIETLVQRLDHKKHDAYILREFDIHTERAGSLVFTAKTWRDGTPTIITRYVSGGGSYQFWFDDGGTLLRWGMPSIPALRPDDKGASGGAEGFDGQGSGHRTRRTHVAYGVGTRVNNPSHDEPSCVHDHEDATGLK